MEFQKHGQGADMACEGLVVESFGFFGLGFFCEAFEFVDDFLFYFYEVFGVADSLLFLTYTPSIYRFNFWFSHVFTLLSSAKSECP